MVRAAPYERVRARQGHRNGHDPRDLVTTHGPLPKLRVSRLLEGGLDFTLFDKYQRRQAAVDAAIGQLFLQGMSTRKLKAIARDLVGAPVSATTVSKTTAALDADLRAYQTKPLTDDVAFLFLDGISQRVRELGIEGKVMLCAFGIHADGTKELLSFRLADVEDTASWRGFLVDLKSRGLKGEALKLVTVDGNPALLKALREVCPLRRLQRCIAHKLRNVVVKLTRAQREAEPAVRCPEKDLFHGFHYFGFPKELWRTIRTTNILERPSREVRRRTRPMGVFTNAESAERIMYGVTKHLNANWQGHPLRQIQQSG